MSRGDKAARLLQQATGARYTTCLAHLRGFATADARGAFMTRVVALPALQPGAQRCAECLFSAPCSCPAGRR